MADPDVTDSDNSEVLDDPSPLSRKKFDLESESESNDESIQEPQDLNKISKSSSSSSKVYCF